MKWLVLAVIILAQQPAKAPEGKGTAEGKGTQVSQKADRGEHQNQPSKQPPSSPPDNQHPSSEMQSAAPKTSDDAEIQGKIKTFTGLLVVVGFLQFAALIGQVVIYCRQAKIMARQAHEMKRQRGYMRLQWQSMRQQLAEMQASGEQTDDLIEYAEKQVAALRNSANAMFDSVEAQNRIASAALKSANAAKEGADAAQKDLELIISKERARLVIELTDTHSIGLEIQEEGFPYHRSKNIVLTHHGPTSAFNVSGRGIMFISRGPIPIDNEEPKGITLSLPTIMRPESPSKKVELFGVLEFGDVTDAVKGDATLHMKAAIEYDDVFGNHHRTPFWYTWEIDRFQPDTTIDNWVETSEWIPWGVEENKAD